MMGRDAVLIAGPTASGKSALALELAERFGGAVINADSMQVYDGLRILTAGPDARDLQRAPHHLYGHVSPEEEYSVGAWLRDVRPVLAALERAGRLPIFCGGTGLYFKALLGSLDEMPAVPAAVRERWRRRLNIEGAASLHALLRERDPVSAARIAAADGQRIVRALEIVEATNKPLSALRLGEGKPLVDSARALKIVLTPDRAVLRERIARRFDGMRDAGALAEARAFHMRAGAKGALAGKAIGVREFARVIDGGISETQAASLAVIRSRQYAKRQETWFRHQFDDSWCRSETPEAALAWSVERLQQV